MRILALLALLFALSSWTGCTSPQVSGKSSAPEISINESGIVTFDNQQLQPGKIASALRAAGFRRTQEIKILIPDNPDRAVMKTVSAELVRSGFTRTVFVKKRKAIATLSKPQ